MKLYEGMFVIDGGLAERDYAGVQSEIENLIKRHGGSVVDLRKWDERRFAYEINRVRRGTYLLVHFEAPPLAMEAMRRDLNLSEKILRQLITIDVDGVPTGEDRPGITSSPVSDLNERDERPSRGGPRGRRRDRDSEGEESGETAETESEKA